MSRTMEFTNTTRGYSVELREEQDGTWSAVVPELPGSIAVGRTPNAAMRELPDVIDLWIEAAQERGVAIPAPRVDPEVSGRILLRIPRDLHRALINRSHVEGVSLNTYLVSALSAAVGESLARRTKQVAGSMYFEKLYHAAQTGVRTVLPGLQTRGPGEGVFFVRYGQPLTRVEIEPKEPQNFLRAVTSEGERSRVFDVMSSAEPERAVEA